MYIVKQTFVCIRIPTGMPAIKLMFFKPEINGEIQLYKYYSKNWKI